MRYNYGAFFNVWDRWMGTFLDNDTVEPPIAILATPKVALVDAPGVVELEAAAAIAN